ncbi:Lar family restriction alleviation protein [Hydrocarboniphaga effusa]|uniref:Lar family restriction alleviation protein n=1 Tax=Hydrocarboniphaga effusa TaxID=243629 RepID=UPI00398C2053
MSPNTTGPELATQGSDAVPALKPCPFCGKQPRVIRDDGFGRAQIFCICRLEPSVIGMKEHFACDVVPAWNTRA